MIPIRSQEPPSEALLARFDGPGPRYTSYPTADRFREGFGEAEHREALAGRDAAAPLSLYVHLPFCESVCYYCACNKIVTRRHERAAPYLDLLEREIALQAGRLGSRASATQLHLGGGTPTFPSDAELARLMAALRAAFDLAAGAEVSIEVDPRTVDEARLAHLAALGFNRLSLGVQDFDPDVQRAVHRVQGEASVAALMRSARSLGFASINVDLIYGLPRQTPASFERTVAQVAALRPDRIALYAYAHLPQRFAPQRRIDPAALPEAQEKVAMLSAAIAGFVARGWCYIGMDHFALPGDSLAVARRGGRLQRNFQGYSTQPDCDLLAFGVSAIAKVGATYAQNARTLPEYAAALEAGRLPIVRGLRLDADDRLRRDVIMALMCQGRVEFAAIEQAHGIDFRAAFAPELEALAALEGLQLLGIEPRALQVTPLGWFFVRAIAMHFDRGLQQQRGAGQERYSRIV